MNSIFNTRSLWKQLAAAIALGILLRSVAVLAEDSPTVLMPAGSWWRYATDYPQSGWELASSKYGDWSEGRGGFGEGAPLAAEVKTPWRSGQIWLRQTVNLAKIAAAPQLFIQHRAEVQVCVNGRLVADVTGNTPRFVPVPIQAEAQASLK